MKNVEDDRKHRLARLRPETLAPMIALRGTIMLDTVFNSAGTLDYPLYWQDRDLDIERAKLVTDSNTDFHQK